MELYEKSLAIAKRLKLKKGVAFTYTNMGYVAYKQDSFNLAIRYTEKARDMFQTLGMSNANKSEKFLRFLRRKAGR